MAHTQKQFITEVPPQRAQGLDPEFTAQPRPVTDELALEASAEPELSVDADELGSRFLRDATEQGDFDPERAWPEESSLIDAPARDQPLDSSNFAADSTVWEQTVDLETRTQGAADLLREPAPLSAADFDLAVRETLPDPIEVDDDSAHISDNNVREFSLFDAADGSTDSTKPRQVARARAKTKSDEQERRNRGAAPRRGSRSARVVRAALSGSARVLRSLASRLQRRGT